ncbi:MAG: HD domain-containing protein [Bacteroidales bacterium]
MKLQDYIEQQILPRYDSFDGAHTRTHVENVIRNSAELAKLYNADAQMCYVIAAYHDLGCCEGREQHHIVSGRILVADKNLTQWFTLEQIETMKEAVEDHRASSDHEPRSLYGKIVAEADRDIDPDNTLRRTVQFGLDHYPSLTKEEQYSRFLAHLKEKYAPGGYLKLYLDKSPNKARLAELRRIIADKDALARRFDELYREERI